MTKAAFVAVVISPDGHRFIKGNAAMKKCRSLPSVISSDDEVCFCSSDYQRNVRSRVHVFPDVLSQWVEPRRMPLCRRRARQEVIPDIEFPESGRQGPPTASLRSSPNRGRMTDGDMKMVTLKIDDETFAHWNRQAQARGLTVEEWLKATTPIRETATEVRDTL